VAVENWIVVFCVMMLFGLVVVTNVSEELITTIFTYAFNMEVVGSSEMLVITYKTY
jgi:predicted membrane chloride channel (bestrophin family)